MNYTWNPKDIPEEKPIPVMGWIRAGLRALVLLLVLLTGVFVATILRVVEKILDKEKRRWSPKITQLVCQTAFPMLGIEYSRQGEPMTAQGVFVSNHVSWLDVFALNAGASLYFVSKAEVSRWPGIGFLARFTGTVFVRRMRGDAKEQAALLRGRLRAGHRLLFFPEGTSTDGMRILPFKSTLFQAILDLPDEFDAHIQPVTLIYRAPNGEAPQFYGWWGDMEFARHLLKTMSARRQGAVHVIYHPPLRARDFAERKTLARKLESTVRSGMPEKWQH